LGLVALAARFHYSVALGAFIMGSIIAESAEAKRIEHLVQPLKDIFGAVFFVSVGMLLDPKAIFENFGAVILISVVIVIGKLLSVTLGAFVTGQTVKNSVQTGFSMAQIGEFSFIIASLGLSYKVVDERLYPIIVAASLVTTFTTPYLVKSSASAGARIERAMPLRMRETLDNYVSWIQRRSVASDRRKALLRGLTKWMLNAVVVISLFAVATDRLVPLVAEYLGGGYLARAIAWIVAFTLSAPSIWAMLSSFRDAPSIAEPKRPFPRGGAQLVARLLTVALIGLLSVGFFPALITLGITLGACALVFVLFRRQIEGYYRWMETQFRSGFQADLVETGRAQPLDRLAPWDAHLVEVGVPARSFLVGRSLLDLELREKYGLNVVVVVRDDENIVAPKASEALYPGDRLLCFATDAEIERFREDIEAKAQDVGGRQKDVEEYELRRVKVQEGSRFNGVSIRQSGIRERFDCIVVGLERAGKRIRSPKSDTTLTDTDVLWIVGETKKVQGLMHELQAARE
jgi:CPA2 family monovalent cation:H+ antiporter-2